MKPFFKSQPRIGVFQRKGPPKKIKSGPISFTGTDIAVEAVPGSDAMVAVVVEPVVVAPKVVTEVGEGYISGKITVVSEAESRNSRRYFNGVCACAPGVETKVCVRIDHLRDRTTTSCGCERDEKLWFGTKARAALKTRLGQSFERVGSGAESGKLDKSLTSEANDTANSEASKAPIIVRSPDDEYFTPEVCPHLVFPVSPPVEGRVFGVSLECFRCHDIYSMSDLIRAWEHTLDLKLETPSRRMEVALGGKTGDYLVKVGTGVELEIVAESDATAETWMDDSDSDDPGDDVTTSRMRRKPAKPVTPQGHGPDD
jgi:hypothetical protein